MNEMKTNGSGYYDPTAYKAMKNFNNGGENMEVYRGDIFLVKNFVRVSGSEQTANRPAVVVSNNIGNYHSDMCQVVYLTTKEKKPLPTHVKVMCQVPSTALCEQVHSVSQDRLTEYVRTCTDEEMKEIGRALMVSFGLDMKQKANLYDCETIDDVVKYQDSKQIDDLMMKLEGAERTLDEKNEQINEAEKHIYEMQEHIKKLLKENSEMEDQIKSENNIDTSKLIFERDFYKEKYENLSEKLINRVMG